jgi:hypothetical protein
LSITSIKSIPQSVLAGQNNLLELVALSWLSRTAVEGWQFGGVMARIARRDTMKIRQKDL